MTQLSEISLLEFYRLRYCPSLPTILKNLKSCAIKKNSVFFEHDNELTKLFPHLTSFREVTVEAGVMQTTEPLRVGALFSGGQAAGGHNVISGLYDALHSLDSRSQLFGFIGGPGGLVKGLSLEITGELLANYRNLGGFDLLGSDRTKLNSTTQAKVLEHVQNLNLDGLVIIGGDDSNTNAAYLAEYFLAKKIKTKVVGVPKTIDGDLKNEKIEISFGFDSATKTFSSIIGNLARDILSAKKIYYFVKLMGRTASSIALECALQTHPNFTLIGEEIAAEKKSLECVVSDISDLICKRSVDSKDYGIILIPEGLLEFISDSNQLFKELAKIDSAVLPHEVFSLLSPESRYCLQLFPEAIRQQLFLDRDPHGNLQVSKIETERLLIAMVEVELEKRKLAGEYSGRFNPQPLFCGYEGRACCPSNFDANYCYALGHVTAVLIQNGLSGYMAAVQDLAQPVESWKPAGVPLVSMMVFETRQEGPRAVINKALVDLGGKPFATFKEKRLKWAYDDEYRYPGPIQFFGPSELTEQMTFTLALESNKALV